MKTETVFSDERFGETQIRWAGGATFNIWIKGEAPSGYWGEEGWWNADCFTHYGEGGGGNSPTADEAELIAAEHFDQMAEEQGGSGW